ncbi:MAG: DNA-binding protein [Sulfuritalea sp.]|nr:DNA-binding protein [Sulfuritalea sp.]
MQRELRSPAQVQTWFRESGVSVVEWAARNGFSTALVYAVMKGNRKCLRGESHHIAVALGMKHEPPLS